MKVLWITSEYFPRVGGLERFVEECGEALADHCSIGLITGEGQSLRPHQCFTHVGAVNLVRPASIAEFEENCQTLQRLAQEFQADVIHLASAGLACYAPALAPLFPVFATVHCKDLTRPWQTLPGRDVSAAIADGLRLCTRVFCVSTYTRAHVDHMVPGVRSVLLTPGLNVHERPVVPVIDKAYEVSDPIVLTVARLIPRKGIIPLLDALEKVQLPFQWHVVGTGAMKDELAERVAASPIRDRVHLHGLVSDEMLQTLYDRCSLFALTPIVVFDAQGIDAEGFGLVYLEAATYGKACIASADSGCAEAVLDGLTGLLVDANDPAAITAGLEKLLASPALCRQLGADARDRVLRDFQWSDRALRMMEEYRQAVAGAGE